MNILAFFHLKIKLTHGAGMSIEDDAVYMLPHAAKLVQIMENQRSGGCAMCSRGGHVWCGRGGAGV